MTTDIATNTRTRQPAVYLWLVPMLFMLIVGVYFAARYEGRWAESDSAAFAQYMRGVSREGSLVSENGAAYPNGYAFQVLSVFVLALTGLDASVLQRLVYPLLASLAVLPAWLLYREWTGSARGAAIGVLVLFTQPEFLFVMLRSSHEKFTRTLLLLCLLWLTHSFKLRSKPGQFALYVGLFYLAAYGLIANNNLLAHSFIFAIGCALVLMVMLERNRKNSIPDRAFVRRFPYVVSICLALTYLFTFYLYPPAQHDLLVLHDLWYRIASLFLDVEAQRSNPYTAVQLGWISIQVYLTLSIANWLLLGSSFVLWAHQGWRWLRGGLSNANRIYLLVWLFYGAFAIQGALTIIADSTGAMSGNLQHRIFSSFSIIAAGLVAITLTNWRPRRHSDKIRFGIASGLACLALLSVQKATNEPLLSNKWTFYRGSELAAVTWGDQHLNDASIWTEFDERLQVAYLTTAGELINGAGETTNRNRLVGADHNDWVREYIVTDVTRSRALRLQQPLPVPLDAHRVYDNGAAELYHARPLTPYQR
jgi:hypothetical protein